MQCCPRRVAHANWQSLIVVLCFRGSFHWKCILFLSFYCFSLLLFICFSFHVSRQSIASTWISTHVKRTRLGNLLCGLFYHRGNHGWYFSPRWSSGTHVVDWWVVWPFDWVGGLGNEKTNVRGVFDFGHITSLFGYFLFFNLHTMDGSHVPHARPRCIPIKRI